MQCDKCQSKRIVSVDAKCSDCCGVTLGNVSHDGYVPKDLGIGGGDVVSFSFCLDCGKIHGQFPLTQSSLEESDSKEEIMFFYENNLTEDKLINYSRVQIKVLLEAGDYLSLKFKTFLSSLLTNNVREKMPSKEKFFEMYLNDSYYI